VTSIECSHRMIFVVLIGLFLLSWLLTYWVRIYALKNQVLDVPNQRSSHTIPTPRGGGLAIVISSQLGFYFCYLFGYLALDEYLGLLVAGLTIAAISFIDDHRHIHPLLRLVTHSVAVAFCLYILRELPIINLGGLVITINWLLGCFLFVSLVWLINLYNFMDGTDGIAGVQAVLIAIGAIIVLIAIGDYELVVFWGVLLVTVGGFLLMNLPPAKIFMGDIGSCYLGLVIGVLGLITTLNTGVSLWVWPILLGFFVVDATTTLIMRVFRGQKWYVAHRSHAYQILTVRYSNHKAVLKKLILINIIWLYPLAVFTVFFPEAGLYLSLLALFPVMAWVVSVGAGKVHATNNY